MTKRVLGHGAKCCGDCELCRPKTAVAPRPVAPKSAKVELPQEDDE